HRLDWHADGQNPGGDRQLLTRSHWRADQIQSGGRPSYGQHSLEAKRVFTMAKDGLSYRMIGRNLGTCKTRDGNNQTGINRSGLKSSNTSRRLPVMQLQLPSSAMQKSGPRARHWLLDAVVFVALVLLPTDAPLHLTVRFDELQ